MKYLGVEIDEKLDFKQLVDTSIKKMAKKVDYGRIQQKLSNTTKMIYNSIISQHHYCFSILFLANEEYLNRMQIIQNRAMRIILRCHRRTMNMNTLVFIFNIKYKMSSYYLAYPNCCTQEKLQHVCSGMLIFVCHSTTRHTHKTLYGMLDEMNLIN
jgi:hypothetical protein